MGREKEKQILDDEARAAAAKREGKRCIYCGSVIPFGQEVYGQNGVCGSCSTSVGGD